MWRRSKAMSTSRRRRLSGIAGKVSLRPNRYAFLPGAQYRSDGVVAVSLTLYWSRVHREPWYLATSLLDGQGDGAAISQTDAAGTVFSRWQAIFCAGLGNGEEPRLGWGVGWWAIVNLLLAAVGGYVREDSWTDELLGLLWLGTERYLAALEPSPDGLACPTPENGYAQINQRVDISSLPLRHFCRHFRRRQLPDLNPEPANRPRQRPDCEMLTRPSGLAVARWGIAGSGAECVPSGVAVGRTGRHFPSRTR